MWMNIEIDGEVFSALEHAAMQRGMSIGELVEDILKDTPAFTEAALHCEGHCRTVTSHRFEKHVPVVAAGQRAFEQRYRCMMCGSERRFGLLGAL